MEQDRKAYPSDVGNEEWEFCGPYLTLMDEGAPQRVYALREIFNAQAPEHHLERAKMYAAAHGWNVVEVYDLAGQTGKAVSEHPEAKRMTADVKRGHINALVFSKLARLSRNLREVQDFGDFFRAHNADLVSLNESIDASTAGGRMFFSSSRRLCPNGSARKSWSV